MLPIGSHAVFNEQLHQYVEAAKTTQKAIEMLERYVSYDHRKEAVAELEQRLELITMTIDGLMKMIKETDLVLPKESNDTKEVH